MKYFFNDVEVSKDKFDELSAGIGELPSVTPRVTVPVAEPVKVKAKKREVTNVVTVKSGKKIDMARDLYVANPGASKEDILVIFMKELGGITRSNASIYFAKVSA
jgi:5,10-methenyltetrahydromethanopterin hydrogenase